MKNSLNNVNEIFSEFAILFLQRQKEVEVRKGRRAGGREGEREERGGRSTDTFFSLPTSFNAKK